MLDQSVYWANTHCFQQLGVQAEKIRICYKKTCKYILRRFGGFFPLSPTKAILTVAIAKSRRRWDEISHEHPFSSATVLPLKETSGIFSMLLSSDFLTVSLSAAKYLGSLYAVFHYAIILLS